MITRKDYIKRGNRQVAAYFHAICAGSRKLYNTSIFYIRNTMSGLNKPPEERTLNETEVLHFVYLGITLYNRARTQAFMCKAPGTRVRLLQMSPLEEH